MKSLLLVVLLLSSTFLKADDNSNDDYYDDSTYLDSRRMAKFKALKDMISSVLNNKDKMDHEKVVIILNYLNNEMINIAGDMSLIAKYWDDSTEAEQGRGDREFAYRDEHYYRPYHNYDK